MKRQLSILASLPCFLLLLFQSAGSNIQCSKFIRTRIVYFANARALPLCPTCPVMNSLSAEVPRFILSTIPTTTRSRSPRRFRSFERNDNDRNNEQQHARVASMHPSFCRGARQRKETHHVRGRKKERTGPPILRVERSSTFAIALARGRITSAIIADAKTATDKLPGR